MLLFVSIVWVLLVTGLLVRAIGQYRHYEVVGPASEAMNCDAPSVAIIVPARNEEQNIGRCLDGVRRQEYPSQRLIAIFVDDGSEDQTASVVTRIAAEDGRVRLIDAGPLPAGWMGKPHACWRGASAANSDWLCFLDADTTAEPPLIRTAIHVAQARGLDLLSLQPFQELITAWERLILPTGFFLIAFTQDLRQTNNPANPKAAVNGQFLLVRRASYEAVGGYAAARDAVAEDSALAGAFKSAGFRVGVLGTTGLLRTRMYTSLRPLWEGTARQAAGLLGGPAALAGAAIAALTLAWVTLALPAWGFVAVLAGGGASAVVSLALASVGSAALFGTHIGAARYFRIPFWYGLLFPLGYTLGAGVCAYALWQRSRGRVRWKGRVYGSRRELGRDGAQIPAAQNLPNHV